MTKPKKTIPTTGQAWQSEFRVSNPHQQLAEVLEFLYTADNAFPSRVNWREALVAKLKEVLGVSEDTNN